MNIYEIITLSVVQGITEFLPISSSAHLILLPYILGWDTHSQALDIFLHGGTFFALIFYYHKRLIQLLNIKEEQNKNLIKNLVFSVIPSLVFALILRGIFENSENQMLTTSIFMILVGIILIICEFNKRTKTIQQLNSKNSFIIGLFQVLSVIPGVSRSGITLIGGLTQSLSKKEALDFAFLSGIPITGLALAYQVMNFKEFDNIDIPLFYYPLSFLITFVVAIVSMRFLKKVVESKALAFFGIYRIILGLIIIGLLIR